MADHDLHEGDLHAVLVRTFPNLHQISKFLPLDISEIYEEFNGIIICFVAVLHYWIKGERVTKQEEIPRGKGFCDFAKMYKVAHLSMRPTTTHLFLDFFLFRPR